MRYQRTNIYRLNDTSLSQECYIIDISIKYYICHQRETDQQVKHVLRTPALRDHRARVIFMISRRN